MGLIVVEIAFGVVSIAFAIVQIVVALRYGVNSGGDVVLAKVVIGIGLGAPGPVLIFDGLNRLRLRKQGAKVTEK